jgi:hypothetical protein
MSQVSLLLCPICNLVPDYPARKTVTVTSQELGDFVQHVVTCHIPYTSIHDGIDKAQETADEALKLAQKFVG